MDNIGAEINENKTHTHIQSLFALPNCRNVSIFQNGPVGCHVELELNEGSRFDVHESVVRDCVHDCSRDYIPRGDHDHDHYNDYDYSQKNH